MSLLQKMATIKYWGKTDNIIAILFFLFGIACLTSKGVMYAFPFLFGVLFIIRYFKTTDIHLFIQARRIIPLSVSIFIIGLLLTFLRNFDIKDTAFFFRKAWFILMIPVYLVFFQEVKNKHAFLLGAILGLGIALGYTFYLFSQSSQPITTVKISSFWDLGRWRELLSYSFSIALPFLFSRHKKIVLLASVIIIGIIPAIILSAGRQPYLVLVVNFIVYLLLFQRSKIKWSIPILIIGLGLFSLSNNGFYQALQQRVTSIGNTTSDYSNIARLTMYHYGSQFAWHNLTTNPVQFLIGTGDTHFATVYTDYLHTQNLDTIMQDTQDQFSKNDNHDAYLNTLNKHGLIYFILFYWLMINMLSYSYRMAQTGNPYYQGALLLLLAYLISGVVYSNEFSFQTIIIFVSWCALISQHRANTDPDQPH